MKNDQKLTFFKLVSSDHRMSTNVFRSVLDTQKTYFEPLNTWVYTSGDDICHFVRHEKIVKITIFTPFLYILQLFSLK